MKYVVVGGGICGIIAAKNISLHHPDSDISLVERAQHLGGLLAGDFYEKDNLYFDQGTHIPRETGNVAIDEFMLGCIKNEDLIHFERGHGDISGSYLNGILQKNSHFPDIRKHKNFSNILNSAEDAARKQSRKDFVRLEAALEQAKEKFGELYCSDMLSPILENMFQKNPKDLSWFALELPGLTRMVTYGADDWKRISSDPNMRAIFAVPDQRDLPEEHLSPYRSFYTSKQGTRTFIESLTQNLLQDNIKILTNTAITGFSFADNLVRINAQKDDKNVDLEADIVVLATGVIGAALLLDIKPSDFGFEKPIAHRLAHLVVDEKDQTDLHYFYGLAADSSFYRVTNYSAITGDAHDKRLTVEVLGERAESDEALVRNVVEQLFDMGFLKNKKLHFSDVRKLNAGFPLPTVKNMKAMEDLRAAVESRLPKNVILGGIGCDGGLFFQNEIVKNIIEKTSCVNVGAAI